eukprot:504542-Rhodomonas_salina.1
MPLLCAAGYSHSVAVGIILRASYTMSGTRIPQPTSSAYAMSATALLRRLLYRLPVRCAVLRALCCYQVLFRIRDVIPHRCSPLQAGVSSYAPRLYSYASAMRFPVLTSRLCNTALLCPALA